MQTSKLSLYLQVSTAAAAVLTPRADTIADQDCSFFLSNGSNPGYYANHAFWDFRSLADYASVPDVVTDYGEASQASVASKYFSSNNWTSSWEIQNWNNTKDGGDKLNGDAEIKMINSPNNIYIQDNDDKDADSDTFLTMRTKRLPSFQTAAEFESTEQYQFLSVRMLARTIGSPGAIAALFTYRDPSGELAKVQEADIEILTRDPRNKISYTNQPSYTDDGDEMPEATRNATLPDGALWSNWLVHRLDWTPEASVWYVDGTEVAKIKFQTPKDGAQVILNAWSDGGSWSGKMPVHDEAYLQIKWLEMVYNKTSSEDSGERRRDVGIPSGGLMRREERDSGVVCSIDDTTEVGKAVEAEQDGGAKAMKWPWLASVITLGSLAATTL
ncbi:glycosyl hydrolases family 16 domain-containing protein [Sarocladium implicatum]|nr:glycosyl hydrolases family 16 domain-containing protein [Sarocladium implicatum]